MFHSYTDMMGVALRAAGMILVAIGASGVVVFGLSYDSLSYAYRFVIVFIASIFITNMLSNVTVLCIKNY